MKLKRLFTVLGAALLVVLAVGCASMDGFVTSVAGRGNGTNPELVFGVRHESALVIRVNNVDVAGEASAKDDEKKDDEKKDALREEQDAVKS
jgi:hypothetical protein